MANNQFCMHAKLSPINVTTPAQSASIRALTRTRTSAGEIALPCMLTLVDGKVFSQAFCNPNPRYSDLGNWIHPESVVRIEESPHRLPLQFARQLYDAGESGMGYFIFELEFRDGRKLVYSAGGNWYLDFPQFPEGLGPADVVSVTPHKGRDQAAASGFAQTAPLVVMDFVFDDDPIVSIGLARS